MGGVGVLFHCQVNFLACISYGTSMISDWILKSENRFYVSLLNRLIQDHLDHGTSKEPKIPRQTCTCNKTGPFADFMSYSLCTLPCGTVHVHCAIYSGLETFGNCLLCSKYLNNTVNYVLIGHPWDTH